MYGLGSSVVFNFDVCRLSSTNKLWSKLKIKDILGSSITANSFVATIGSAPYYLLARYKNYSEKKKMIIKFQITVKPGKAYPPSSH